MRCCDGNYASNDNNGNNGMNGNNNDNNGNNNTNGSAGCNVNIRIDSISKY